MFNFFILLITILFVSIVGAKDFSSIPWDKYFEIDSFIDPNNAIEIVKNLVVSTYQMAMDSKKGRIR